MKYEKLTQELFRELLPELSPISEAKLEDAKESPRKEFKAIGKDGKIVILLNPYISKRLVEYKDGTQEELDIDGVPNIRKKVKSEKILRNIILERLTVQEARKRGNSFNSDEATL